MSAAVALSAFIVGAFATTAAAAGGSGDFNNDGFMDLAIGAPLVDVADASNAGAVKELRGGPAGLAASGRMWHQDKIADNAQAGDRFGSALAAGDFNGDRFADLAIGVPYEDLPGFPPVGGKVNAGGVNVIYGSMTGLRAGNNFFWHQDRPAVENAEPGDRFGSALAAGDFNHDGFADLAIGVPGENFSGVRDAGAVNILHGGGSGLRVSDQVVYDQDGGSVESNAQAGDRFGSALAAGNFGDSAHEDLAIGVPYEDAGNRNSGAVNVLYGSPVNLTAKPGNLLYRARPGMQGGPGPYIGEHFGSALAAADLGRSTEADLAIGAPFADVAGQQNAGSLNVLYGTASTGLTVSGNQLWHRNVPGVKKEPAPGDRFGSALAAGNFDGLLGADLAIGVPFADAADVPNAGSVNVLYSAQATLTADGGLVADGPPTGDDEWHRKIPGVRKEPASGDRFGAALAAGNFDRLLGADLAIGVPFADIADKPNAGSANVLYSGHAIPPGDGGLVSNAPPTEDDDWDRTSPGIEGGPKDGDRFGRALG